ncbi:MAG: hypothetical protein M3Q48_15735 [Actinomycetota bacterium]|nr:hypothetical protein [Actinomycetota bacterium]
MRSIVNRYGVNRRLVHTAPARRNSPRGRAVMAVAIAGDEHDARMAERAAAGAKAAGGDSA